MQPYPRNIQADAQDEADALNIISRLRDQDIIDRNNFPNIFLSGRTVNRTPASSSDVETSDRINDVSIDPAGTYIYYCINASGTVAWRRIALSAW